MPRRLPLNVYCWIRIVHNSMRILVDGSVYGFQPHGGVNTYFSKLMTCLSTKPDVHIDVVVPRSPAGLIPNGRIRHLRAVRVDLRAISYRLHCSLARHLDKALMTARARSRFNCVFHSTLYTTVYRIVPQVATVYDLNHERLTGSFTDERWRQWLQKTYPSYVKAADKVIAISHATKADLVRYYGIPAERIQVVHLATDRREFYFDDDVSACTQWFNRAVVSRPFVLYVGGRWHYKNFSTLLKAFAASRFSRDGLLLVAGGPWTEAERSQIESLGLLSRVKLIENPPVPALRILYSLARALVYPSLYEGFGIPLLEAMACQTAVVASDTAVFREVAGDAAQYFDPKDISATADAIDQAIEDGKRRALIEAGDSQVSKYSWERCAEETYRVYRDVLGARMQR